MTEYVNNINSLYGMFKPVLVYLYILFVLFVKAQDSGFQENKDGNLSKSFTAVCENSANCTYSLVLSSTSTSYSVDVTIFVDTTIEFTGTVSVTSSIPVTVNFNVTQGNQIAVVFSVQPAGSYLRFQLYNQADGNGVVVQDSKSLKFSVFNTCTGENSCSLSFTRSSEWAPNILAQFKINGTVSATLDNLTRTQTLSFKAFDNLSVEIVGNPADIIDNLIVAVLENQFSLFWFSNSYFTPMLATGNCLPPSPPIPSPFGGPLIPLTQEQIDIFLKTIGASYSTLWYRLTKYLD